jgi:phage terminase large subunit
MLFELLDSKNINKDSEIIADSAEPKSIEEIRRAGFNIHSATKGKDSVIFGIEKLKEHNVCYTDISYNIEKEYYNYSYKTNRADMSITNQPIDDYNHAMDAIRYGISKPSHELIFTSI